MPTGETVLVEQVINGSTLEVRASDRPDSYPVRLLGLEAPALNQSPWGENAAAYLRQWLVGQRVLLETDTEPEDANGRQLAYLWLDNRLVNEQLITEGWALAVTRSPNLRYDRRLHQAQLVARALHRGIWNPDNPLRQTPEEGRR